MITSYLLYRSTKNLWELQYCILYFFFFKYTDRNKIIISTMEFKNFCAFLKCILNRAGDSQHWISKHTSFQLEIINNFYLHTIELFQNKAKTTRVNIVNPLKNWTFFVSHSTNYCWAMMCFNVLMLKGVKSSSFQLSLEKASRQKNWNLSQNRRWIRKICRISKCHELEW